MRRKKSSTVHKHRSGYQGNLGLIFTAVVIALLGFAGWQWYKTQTSNDVLQSQTYRHIIVDHNSVALFDQIPDQYIQAAANLRMMFMDRSVGNNIHESLNCLAYPSTQQAPSYCKKPTLESSQLVSNAKYNRSNWVYEGWPGGCAYWYDKNKCFIDRVNVISQQYDVMSYQFSYLEVDNNSSIENVPGGFFTNNSNRSDVYDFIALENQYPDKRFIYWTTSLARSIGTPESETFNRQMRDFAITNNKVLFDVADILSHDVEGRPCYDNRDGVQYCTRPGVCENYPDDGLNIPAICSTYTSENDGGHLGNQATGGIRVAKAFWVLMAQLAGWVPQNQPNPSYSTNQPPVVNAGLDQTVMLPNAVNLTATLSDDTTPVEQLVVTWSKLSGPGTVQFANSGAALTSASFTLSGTYVLRVQVSDGVASSQDDVTITVQNAVIPSPSASPTLPTGSPQPSPSSSSGNQTLRAYWSFDQNSVSEDLNGCTTCINNGATWTADGYAGGAFNFNGTTNYLKLGSLPSLNNSSNFSMSFWMKPTFDETESYWKYIVSKDNITFFFLGGQKKFRYSIRTSAGNAWMDMLGLNWDANTWHKVTLEYDGATMRAYWDDQLIVSKAHTGTMVSSPNPLYFGTSVVLSSNYSGLLDELRVSTR